MTTDRPLGRRMCATCRLILTPLEIDRQVTWVHGQAVDHEPVVGSLVDPVLLCDFCSSPDAGWRAECHPFRIDTTIGRFDLAAQDDGAWAACDPCASYIKQHDWPRLLYRATKAMTWPPGIDGKAMIALLHDEFRQHHNGVITPLGQSDR